MTLKERIAQDMKTAMREKDKVRLETIRLLRAAVQRREVDDRTELNETEVLSVIQKMVKQCQDAAQQFDQAGRDDLSSKERSDIEILSQYLPTPLDADELQSIIADVIKQTGAESMKDMGKVMGQIKSRVEGRADMGQVSAKIRQLLG